MVEIYRVATYIKIEWEEIARTLDIKNNGKEVLQQEKTSQCSAICNFSKHRWNLETLAAAPYFHVEKKKTKKRHFSAPSSTRDISQCF